MCSAQRERPRACVVRRSRHPCMTRCGPNDVLTTYVPQLSAQTHSRPKIHFLIPAYQGIHVSTSRIAKSSAGAVDFNSRQTSLACTCLLHIHTIHACTELAVASQAALLPSPVWYGSVGEGHSSTARCSGESGVLVRPNGPTVQVQYIFLGSQSTVCSLPSLVGLPILSYCGDCCIFYIRLGYLRAHKLHFESRRYLLPLPHSQPSPNTSYCKTSHHETSHRHNEDLPRQSRPGNRRPPLFCCLRTANLHHRPGLRLQRHEDNMVLQPDRRVPAVSQQSHPQSTILMLTYSASTASASKPKATPRTPSPTPATPRPSHTPASAPTASRPTSPSSRRRSHTSSAPSGATSASPTAATTTPAPPPAAPTTPAARRTPCVRIRAR